jgi:NTE family protein
LVLGGGGVAGIAWETGVLFGLSEHGVDVRGADRVIGTSAGSTAGAQLLSGTPLGELYDRHVFPPEVSTEITVQVDVEEMARTWGALLAGHQPGADLRAAIGRHALAAPTASERERRAVIEARLPSHDWPDADLRIVAVDATTGEERVFTSADGVSIVDAVAASCAVPGVWPPVTIDGRRYIDGGVRSSANVDLAEGCDAVLVLAPVGDLTAPEPAIGTRLERLRRKATVLTIEPDDASRAAMGANALDPATARPSAQAGRAQDAAVAADVATVWR